GFDAFEVRHVRRGKVATGNYHIVERLGIGALVCQVFDRDAELLRRLVEVHPARHRAEPDAAAHIALVDTALDVVEQNGARGKRRDGTTEVLVKGVIGELQAFLGAVGPQVAIHAAMYRLAMLVQTGAPRVVPQAAPVRL